MAHLEANNLTMNKLYKIIGALAFIAIVAVFVQRYPAAKADITGLPVWGPLPTQATSTCVIGLGSQTPTASSTPVLATSTGGRTYLRITNTGSGTVYLGLGQSAATSSGVVLFASSTWERDATQVLWMGSVYCEADTLLNKTAPVISVETIGS